MVAAGVSMVVITMLVMYLAGLVWNPTPPPLQAAQPPTSLATILADIPASTTILPNISFSGGETVTYTLPIPTLTVLPVLALPDEGYLTIPNPVSSSVQITPGQPATPTLPVTGEVTTPSSSTPEPVATSAASLSPTLAIATLPPVTAQPARLTISSIGLSDFEIRPVGLEMVKLPNGKRTQQWQALDYTIGYHTSPPGQICKCGLTVLNGHNWWRQKPSVFVNLHRAKPGDLIEASDSQGVSCSYRVEEVKQYGPLETSWLGFTLVGCTQGNSGGDCSTSWYSCAE